MVKKVNQKESAPPMPPVVFAEASVHSVGGVSLFEATELVTSETVDGFYSEPQLVNDAIRELRALGFDVQHVGDTTITIAGPADVYERAFSTRIVAEEREAIKEFGQETTATFLECPDTPVTGLIETRGTSLEKLLEGVSINEPVYYFANPFPPSVGYWHLDVPADVSVGMNADLTHRAGFTGRCVRVVMVDSGWYRHPFFVQRGYRSAPVVLGPGATGPNNDEHGHGTGESANVFAVAPDVEFTMVKMSTVNALGAFKTAVGLEPDIISCSWGYSRRNPPLSAADQALAAGVADAVRRGITVVFSAGNGHWGFPGQHPDVISAGGVYMHPDSSFEATPYASGFSSNIYKGRDVPDVCGLVGLPSGDPASPGAMYIMLPVEPDDYLDGRLYDNGANHYRSPGATPPFGDETAPDDGWAAFSGTSAAAPQLAGVCALILEACRPCGWLSPQQIRDILVRTARDVTRGSSSPSTGGNQAARGPDLAAGHGLADAFRAAMLAWFQCKMRPSPSVPRRVPRPPRVRAVKPVPPRTAEEEAREEQFLEDISHDSGE